MPSVLGVDHIRLNAVKAIVHCFWDPFFKGIFQVMGYESPAALNTAYACSDLHKTEQILGVLLAAGSQTLVKEYIDTSNEGTGTADGFFRFVDSSVNDNIKLLYNVVFNYITGYFILKAAVRKCRWDYFLAGKNLLSPLFFGKNHPMYRKLFVYLDFDLAQMPESMYTHFKETIGLKVENKGCEKDPDVSCEHFDFILENVNKKLKQNLSWAPNDSTWLVSCRTHDMIVNLENNFDNYFNLTRSVSKAKYLYNLMSNCE